MKVLKKLSAALLCVCLAVPVFGNIASAADGRLLFTDPQGKVGENVDVEMVVRSGEGNIGDVNVTMSYDTSAMEFVSGDGCEADGSGTLKYTGSGDGDGEFRTTMVFRPLKTGEAKLSVSDSSVTLESGDTLNLQVGSSKVTVAAADDGSTTAEPTSSSSGTTASATDIVVQVDGTDYNFSEAFTNVDIPNGYAETTQNFEGADRKFAANDSGIYLGYLVNSEGEGRFFLYNTEDGTFAPYIELSISDSASIIPLNEPDQVKLPEEYQKANLTVLDQEYPIWSDPSKDRFYLMYALNVQTGEKGLYQYDTQDSTYQSYTAPTVEEETTKSILPGKIGELIGNYALILLVVAAVVILLLLILMIVFAVKLVHRNQELDDLYDEYDIPYDDEDEEDEEEVQIPKKKKRFFGRKEEEEQEEEFDDDDYDDDEDYDDEYEDEEEDEKSRRSKTKNVKKPEKASKDDDYDIDFIDL